MSSTNKTNPSDVLAELFYGGKGGGGGGDEICNRSSATAPYVADISDEKTELMQMADFYTCGWKADEQVNVRIQYPNGRIVEDTDVASGSFGESPLAYHYFQALWNDPTGKYRITFSGSSGSVALTLDVIRPMQPRVVTFGDNRILIHHFSPYEKFRVFIYGECEDPDLYAACIVGWQEYQADSQGNLMLTLGWDVAETELAIVGEKSGEVVGLWSSSEYSTAPVVRKPGESHILRSSCPGAPPQRFRVNRVGEVCTRSDRVKVRQEPSRTAREITRLEPGAYFKVIGGPVCADRWSWWEIEWEGVNTGWIAEGGDNVDPYFICPIGEDY